MSLLKNLLDMHQAAAPHHEEPIQEARGGSDMNSLMDKWMDMEGAYSWEGERGVKNFDKLVSALGYDDASDFLRDNPGGIQALVDFITHARVADWEEALSNVTGGDDDDR